MPFTVQWCTVNRSVNFQGCQVVRALLLFVQGHLYLLEFKMRLVWISALYEGTEEDSQVGSEASIEAK